MKEKRGSTLLKRLDHYVGGACLAILVPLVWLLSILRPGKQANPNVYLVVCIGAIGDLILLTEAVRSQLQGKQVFLACSKSNLVCARMYNDVYAGIDLIDIRSLLDIYRVCKKRDVDTVYDSTQWANIGPVQTGLARLLKRGLVSVGFRTESLVRNGVYSYLVSHSPAVHETANFMNLLAGHEVVQTNTQLQAILSSPYQQLGRRDTYKVLLHMWPSGARAYLKEWPESYWIELARYFLRIGYRVYLSGAPVDKPRNDAFIRKAGLSDLVNIAGAYDLSALSVFVRDEIECAVSVNTGILHLVASLGVPIIGLHGPTNPVRWGPLGANSMTLLPESGNFAYLNYGFEYPVDDADAYALDQLTVQQVIGAFEQLKHVKS